MRKIKEVFARIVVFRMGFVHRIIENFLETRFQLFLFIR